MKAQRKAQRNKQAKVEELMGRGVARRRLPVCVHFHPVSRGPRAGSLVSLDFQFYSVLLFYFIKMCLDQVVSVANVRSGVSLHVPSEEYIQ